MGTQKENWGEVPELTAQQSGRLVYAVDQRNHGDSEWSDEWDFDLNADDVLNFMDEQRIEKAVLVGHSMGGIAAFKVALKAPGRVEKLFIEDISTKPLPVNIIEKGIESYEMLQGCVAKMASELNEEEVIADAQKTIHSMLPPEFNPKKTPPPSAELIGVRRKEGGGWTLKSNADVFIRLLREPSKLQTPFVGLYSGPVTVVCGGKSHLPISDDADDIREHFPSAEVVTVGEASHYVHGDCPVEFQRLLKEFLDK